SVSGVRCEHGGIAVTSTAQDGERHGQQGQRRTSHQEGCLEEPEREAPGQEVEEGDGRAPSEAQDHLTRPADNLRRCPTRAWILPTPPWMPPTTRSVSSTRGAVSRCEAHGWRHWPAHCGSPVTDSRPSPMADRLDLRCARLSRLR